MKRGARAGKPRATEVRGPRRAAVASSSSSSPSSLLPSSSSIPIVGIGASAGGLEALEQFVSQLPASVGMAFVIVQHMDPTHVGMLAQLLERVSRLPVVLITDQLVVEADHLYVIPPNYDLSVLHGVLHLLAPIAPRGLRLPIDFFFFFCSLAEDQRERSIGVILSGMGGDGTVGLRAIRDAGGAAFVQAPGSAKFDGMPTSAIGAGLADVVAPVQELPARILAYYRHAFHFGRAVRAATNERLQGGVDKVVAILRASSGQDFSLYKSSTLHRRIQRRMDLHQIVEVDRYTRYLRENPNEAALLFKELLIGVTGFFRDPGAWQELEQLALPALLAGRPAGVALRAWVPACSTGEEAYSLAITLREALDQVAPPRAVMPQIFATDLDADAVERARRGLYPATIANSVSPARLARFFVAGDDGYRVRREIRDMVVFATQNLIQDPPFTKLDLLTCRNVLIYLNNEPQQKLVPLFHYCLRPNGILFLGTAETIGEFTDLFAPISRASQLYRRVDSLRAESIELPSQAASSPAPDADTAPVTLDDGLQRTSVQALAERFLLGHFAPPAVLTSRTGDVVCVSGRTGPYLELPAGKVNWNLFAMVRDGLRRDVVSAFHEAVRSAAVVKRVGLRAGGAGSPLVDVVVEPIREPAALRGMIISCSSIAMRVRAALPRSRSERRAAPGPAWSASAIRLATSCTGRARRCRRHRRSCSRPTRSCARRTRSCNRPTRSSRPRRRRCSR